ncbi:hypothetical protein [Actinomadura hibisca]|uniref:hypothetical protein n=1 Tax=Actinomadura hibisca TaxID=68565 RepID=UPI0012F8C214|nr:hypothetical protein [Actinomadura hibisca]
MSFTTRDSLRATGQFLEHQYLRVVDRRQDETGQQLTEDTEPGALFALLRLHASFAQSLIEIITVGPNEPGGLIHIRPEGRGAAAARGRRAMRPPPKTTTAASPMPSTPRTTWASSSRRHHHQLLLRLLAHVTRRRP